MPDLVLEALQESRANIDWTDLAHAPELLKTGDLYGVQAYTDYVKAMFTGIDRNTMAPAAAAVYRYLGTATDMLKVLDQARPEHTGKGTAQSGNRT